MQVIFRKDKKTKDIVAFIPETLVHRYMIMSYMHIGQHSEASLEYYLSTEKANKNEYVDLYKELCGIYGEKELQIKQRLNRKLLEQWWV